MTLRRVIRGSGRSLVLLALGALPVGAEPCEISSEVALGRPDPEGPPTQISIGIYVVDLMEIDSARQSFSADLFFSVKWRDPRLAFDDSCSFDLTDIWQPRVDLLNQRRLMRLVEENLRVDPDGLINYQRRFNGELQAAFDVREFPFDRQELPISAASTFPSTEIELVVDERTGALPRFSVAGWSVEPGAPRTSTEYLESLGRDIVRFDLPLAARRNKGFYVWKMLVPLSLIVLMAWSVFWLDPQYLPSRIGISTATIFSLIAFQLALGRILPPVAYMTRADRFVIGSMVLVFAALGIVIAAANLIAREKADRARRLNQWSRWLYLALLVLLIASTVRP